MFRTHTPLGCDGWMGDQFKKNCQKFNEISWFAQKWSLPTLHHHGDECGSLFPQNNFVRSWMKCLDLHRNVMITHPQPMQMWVEGREVKCQKLFFLLGIAWNVQICTGNSFATPTPWGQVGWRWGQIAKSVLLIGMNGISTSAQMTCFPIFHPTTFNLQIDWYSTLPLRGKDWQTWLFCRSGHLMQFLAKIFLELVHNLQPNRGWGWKYNLSVQIWTFYSVPKNKMFLGTDPP